MTIFKFNKLYIIESLCPDNISDGYNTPNINLSKCLDSLQKQERLCFFKYELIQIHKGFEQFKSTIEMICAECTNGIFPIIHFLGHGSQGGGIYLWNEDKHDDEMLAWKELYTQLALVNSSCHNNLFFTTTACHGFDSYRELFADEVSTIPFVGIIAIDPDESFYVHDADIVFCTFYKVLLETMSVNDAIEAVHSQEKNMYGKIPYMAFSDDTFRHVYPKAQEQSYKITNIERLVNIVAKQLNLSPKTKEKTLNDFLKEVDKHKQEDYIRIRDKKFLFDDPLVNKARFNLPDCVEEL